MKCSSVATPTNIVLEDELWDLSGLSRPSHPHDNHHWLGVDFSQKSIPREGGRKGERKAEGERERAREGEMEREE